MVISIRKGINIGKIKNLLTCVQQYVFKKKKSVVVNRERFIESVYHLFYYGNILDKINYTKKDFTSDFSEDQIKVITFPIQWNIIIMTQSLTDESTSFYLIISLMIRIWKIVSKLIKILYFTHWINKNMEGYISV